MARSRPNFEDAMRRVEQIVESIEQGQVGLEDSIKQFEEGMKLIQHCRGVLADAELKIQKLQAGPDGELSATPMDDALGAAPPADESDDEDDANAEASDS